MVLLGNTAETDSNHGGDGFDAEMNLGVGDDSDCFNTLTMTA